MESGIRGTAHILHITLTFEVADAHSHRRPHAVVHHKRELRNREHYLMGRQSDSAQPAHHDSTKAERSRLHPHLQADGPAQRIKLPEHRERPPHA